MNAQPSAKPNPERIFAALNAYIQTAALRTAIELDIFTAIDEGKSSAAELAAHAKISPRGARTLCDYITVHGFLRKVGDRYLLTPESTAFLSKRSPAYMGSVTVFLGTPRHFQNVFALTEAVRRGGSAAGHGDNHEPDDEFWVAFARSMGPMMVPAANFMAGLIDAKSGKPQRVLDIAAGHGVYGVTIAKQNPNAEITAVDWPNVLAVARENAETSGVAARYKFVPGSAFEADFGGGYDVVLLTNLIHHFSIADSVALFKRMHAALKPGGKLLTLEFVPNEDRVSPPVPATFSMNMLIATNEGDAYTYAEYQKMLADAGFAKTELHAVPDSPQHVVLAVK
jgi:ubiquinone/menaquinone biosynthesis C-methylase UbiE